jgi:uncharacterized membrane protein YheB (UPF0754 family)
MPSFLSDPEFWKYVSIPIVAGVVGWSTNWVAVKMTFLPEEFVGIRPFLGWQGIIPSKATKMAGIFVDTSMARLGRLSELFQELDPDRIAAHISDYLAPNLKGYTDEIVGRAHPELWERLPDLVKTQVYVRVHDRLPELVERLVDEVGADFESFIDFKQMITVRLEGDKGLLNRLFIESGRAEFDFIVRSGFYFGFLFGLIQLAVWYLYPAWWVLPAFGLAVGYATNWIALNLIFRPLHPQKIGPWTLQGLFLQRQPEVAAVWCGIVTREILTVRALTEAMLEGPKKERLQDITRRNIEPIVDEALGVAGGLAELAVGERGLEEMRTAAAEVAVEVSSAPFDDPVFNEERSEVAERFLRERMEALPSEQFQDLLRPCFQEDELKLILLGAALGFAAGWAQLVLVFGGG